MTRGTHTMDLAGGQGFRMKSLRVRIILFAVLVCLILLTMVGVVIAVLRNTQSATLNNAARNLHTVALKLEQTYDANSRFAINLSQLDGPERHLPKAAGPGPEPAPPPPPLPPPLVEASSSLEQLMSNTLISEEGVEGGFFRLENGVLGGYSFPTHEAPGPPKEMPLRERPTIEGLARSAAASGVEQTLRFQGQHDAVLFNAIPLRASNAPNAPVIGAAWLMERMPGAESEQRRQLLWGAFGFASMALLICAGAFVILSEVHGGLLSISSRLDAVVSDAEIPAKKTKPLEEFENVLSGIDRMARDLQEKIQRERSFEARMAHQERLAAVGQFAAGIAHELRNPLATIRLRTQMSQQSGNDGMTATNSRVVLAEIDRLTAMIGKLLHFAQPVQAHEALLDLTAVSRDRVQRWNEEYGAGSVQLHEPAESLIVSGDGEEFRQVLDNLLENALQASTSTSGLPLVEVSIGLSGTDAVVNVLDHGSGFDKESLRKAIEPFYTTKEGGTGLGLAIASEIVRARGGELSIANREGGGGSVHFQIPVHAPQSLSKEEQHA